MSKDALVTPSVMINGTAVSIIPNSFTVRKGIGTRKVDVQTTGGQQTEVVVQHDVSTKKGYIKFEIWNTTKNMDLIDSIYGILPVPSLIMFLNQGGQSGSMSNAILINEPEYNLGSDGKTTIEFEGSAIK